MPNPQSIAKSSGSLPDAAHRFAEALGDAQHEAQKQCLAAWRKYVDAVKAAMDQPKMQEEARAYAEGLQKSVATQDTQLYLETTRQYATAAQEAQEELRARLKEAYQGWVSDLQRATADVAGTQRVEFEKYVQALQSAFQQEDASRVDAATLAKVGNATLAAAVLRAHLA